MVYSDHVVGKGDDKNMHSAPTWFGEELVEFF
jgi:hypothetical protein